MINKTFGSVLIVGGGVTGVQAALDLADSGYFVYLVEKSGAIGGTMVQFDKTFPTNDCSMCIVAPKLVECGRHLNIQLLNLSEVTDIKGSVGDFTITVTEQPRYVDLNKCTACGLCATVCPQRNKGRYDSGARNRNAIYLKYPQAVPLKYQIDPTVCLRFGKEEICGQCEKVCDPGAINFQDSEKIHTLSVGALILAPGFEPFDPENAGIWGYGKYPNVVTSMELEHYLSSSGPTGGELVRPSDGEPVKKIAFLQCVGSRDKNRCENEYCSSVCCMSAIKGAMVAKSRIPELLASIYYMDMRTHGKNFEEYYERAKKEVGIQFVRCRVHGVEPHLKEGDLRLHFFSEKGHQVEATYDMVVLSVGFETPPHMIELAQLAGIQLSASNFAATSDFAPVLTSKKGIYTCGAFSGPKDIPQSVTEGSAAAAAVAEVLAPLRGKLTQEKIYPEERKVLNEKPRIGVYICHCGSNIAGIVDVETVEKYAATLPGVVHVERNLFSCAQDTQEILKKSILERGLNRIVIAACTPRTHEHLFRETLKSAGLNEYLVEMANIRNQNSWVHSNVKTATMKANDLVRMAVAKVALSEALYPVCVPVIQKGLIVGGGIAGMTAALNLAKQGFEVDLVEKTENLGGNALNLKHTYSGEHIPMQVRKLIDSILQHDKITIHMKSQVCGVEGYVGNFKTSIKTAGRKKKTLDHGIGILATGGAIFTPDEYGYNSLKNVVTSIEFEKLHELGETHVKHGKSFVFVQCVGSREEGRMYCSKVCCTYSVQSAIELKREDPSRDVYILYRDMRTYGERESLYSKARELGVVFVNYEIHGKPKVSQDGNQLNVEVWDHVLHRPLRIQADMVVLAVAIVANEDAEALARLYNIPLDVYGFFQEAHVKIRPVDFTTDGLFTAGLAHYPKPVDESVAQALAASSRAATFLSQLEISHDAIKAVVDDELCDGCALCIDVCPFHAIELKEIESDKEGEPPTKTVTINSAQCKGCGQCQGTCPKRGVYVAGFTMEQLSSQVKAALKI